MRAGISTVDADPKSLLEKVLASPDMKNRELASDGNQYETLNTFDVYTTAIRDPRPNSYHIVAYDFGVKTNSLREFAKYGCKVTVVPAETSAERSAGSQTRRHFPLERPGRSGFDDRRSSRRSKKLTDIASADVRHLSRPSVDRRSLRSGETYKMKFGHRGGNQPIKDLTTGKVEITSHNHGFAVDADSLPADVEVTHVNLNDNTVAGLQAQNLARFLSAIPSRIRSRAA